MNPYEMAITSVGKIIEDYDSDKLFPVHRFGARLRPTPRTCFRQIELYGAIKFAPTINHMVQVTQNFLDGSQYFILLIVTDGIITDMEQTKSAIVDAALLPISIIIVGVGAADFDAMEELDGDTVRVTDKRGRVASRDIVQFVPMRNFLGIGGPNLVDTGAYLAKEVLAEIPNQFLEFMKSRNIAPNTHQAISINE